MAFAFHYEVIDFSILWARCGQEITGYALNIIGTRLRPAGVDNHLQPMFPAWDLLRGSFVLRSALETAPDDIVGRGCFYFSLQTQAWFDWPALVGCLILSSISLEIPLYRTIVPLMPPGSLNAPCIRNEASLPIISICHHCITRL